MSMIKAASSTTVTTYSLTMSHLKALIASDLGVSLNQVELRAKYSERGDDRFGPTSKELVGVDVIVKPSVNQDPGNGRD